MDEFSLKKERREDEYDALVEEEERQTQVGDERDSSSGKLVPNSGGQQDESNTPPTRVKPVLRPTISPLARFSQFTTSTKAQDKK